MITTKTMINSFGQEIIKDNLINRVFCKENFKSYKIKVDAFGNEYFGFKKNCRREYLAYYKEIQG